MAVKNIHRSIIRLDVVTITSCVLKIQEVNTQNTPLIITNVYFIRALIYKPSLLL